MPHPADTMSFAMYNSSLAPPIVFLLQAFKATAVFWSLKNRVLRGEIARTCCCQAVFIVSRKPSSRGQKFSNLKEFLTLTLFCGQRVHAAYSLKNELSFLIAEHLIEPNQLGLYPFIAIGKSPILQGNFREFTIIKAMPKASHQSTVQIQIVLVINLWFKFRLFLSCAS
jgi:hypothetical protein